MVTGFGGGKVYQRKGKGVVPVVTGDRGEDVIDPGVNGAPDVDTQCVVVARARR
jgi:hypothetical protein